MSAHDAQVRRNRAKLLLIFVLFLLPPVSAYIAFKLMAVDGAGDTTNAGTLVSPARPLTISGLIQADGETLADQDLRGHWTYVVFGGERCDQRCVEQLYLTRQIRLAMNKDIRRVQRLLVLDRAPEPAAMASLASEHEDLLVAVRGDGAAELLQRFRGDGFAPGGEQYFLVDPLGNLMMFYTLDVPARGMMKDLQKLLKISQIG